MCGLVGYADLRGQRGAEQDVLERMTEAIVHRGPDSSGFFTEACVGLGFRRLCIIDLEGGHQPIYNEDGSVVLVCNGEIYNYRELRDELRRKGHTFSTDCDVEVLVHLYEEEGTRFLNRLNGQFAFAIYDRKRRELFLARDHFGINPLFYTVADGTFIFASEIKAILRHPLAPREVDLTGLDQILTAPGLVSPRTMFKGVESLKSGHYLTVKDGRVEVSEYWDLDYPAEGELAYDRPESFYVDMLADLFDRSVRYRLQADVPVGFYLSGGLDSSLIAATINRVSPAASRHSFSIAFSDRAMSESKHQRAMARHVGSIHHEIMFDWEEIAERLRAAIYHCECPIKESYNTCSMALSEATKRHGITVILTGEGADELFAGYVGYRFDRSGLQRGGDRYDLEAVYEEELRERVWGDSNIFYEQDLYALRETKAALYSTAVAETLDEFDCLNFGLVNPARLKGRHPIHQRSYLDFKLRLSDHLISDHGDRMALANSVEARYPFLDVDLVDFARQIPPGLKLKGLTEKYIVKRIAEGLVPRDIIEREKFGFHAPGSPALLRRGLEWVNDLLSYERIKRQGYFNPDVIERLKAQYSREGFALNLPFESDLLIVVLTFGLFLDVFDLAGLN
ncbi:MAG: asparagine synthase (glutamine-hydrolyzing) [Pyrinomonadaceae bacterium]